MIIKLTEFFRNLPRKKCLECGHEMEEQHECYGNTCEKCLKVTQL